MCAGMIFFSAYQTCWCYMPENVNEPDSGYRAASEREFVRKTDIDNRPMGDAVLPGGILPEGFLREIQCDLFLFKEYKEAISRVFPERAPPHAA